MISRSFVPKPFPHLELRAGLARVMPHLLLACALLGAWQAICRLVRLPRYLVPAPSDIVQSVLDKHDALLGALQITVAEAAATLAVSTVLGVCTAILLASSRWAERLAFPYIVVFQAVPIVATAPLILIWLGPAFSSIVIIATVMTVFPILSNMMTGLRATDRQLVDCFMLNGARGDQILWQLRLPAALPYLGTGLKIASPLAVVGVIVGEYIAGLGSGSAGLGFLITQYALRLETPGVFAAGFTAAAVGIVFWQGVSSGIRFLLKPWHESEMEAE